MTHHWITLIVIVTIKKVESSNLAKIDTQKKTLYSWSTHLNKLNVQSICSCSWANTSRKSSIRQRRFIPILKMRILLWVKNNLSFILLQILWIHWEQHARITSKIFSNNSEFLFLLVEAQLLKIQNRTTNWNGTSDKLSSKSLRDVETFSNSSII